MNTDAGTPASPQTRPAPTPAEILAVCERAAEVGAAYIRGVDRDHVAREYKTSNHDIVTEHDRAVEEIVVRELLAGLPGARILGEEGGHRGGDGPVELFIDPIDGTSNFAAGLPLFCISIGAAVDGELVAGVIHAPILGMVFTAADGPAMLNGTPIAPRSTRPAKDALLLTALPAHRMAKDTPEFALEVLRVVKRSHSAVRTLGTAAIELAFVAAGWADGAALDRSNPWDVAAGFHLVSRAGGSLRTWPGTGPEDAPDHLRPAYLACTGPERLEEMDTIMEEIQRRCAEQ